MRRTYKEMEAADELVLEEAISGQIAAEEETEVEPVVEPVVEPEPASLIGVVSGCKKLNVRQEASTDSDPVCVIPENDLVVIDTAGSTDGWYKVFTEAGVEGFCMAQYITIKE